MESYQLSISRECCKNSYFKKIRNLILGRNQEFRNGTLINLNDDKYIDVNTFDNFYLLSYQCLMSITVIINHQI